MTEVHPVIRYRRVGLHVLAAGLVVVILSSCAGRAGTSPGEGSGAGQPARAAASRAAGPATVSARDESPDAASAGAAGGAAPGCPGGGQGFSLSIAAGFVGAATPLEAAQRFAAGGEVAGFPVSATSRWRVSGSQAQGSVTLASGDVTLHALRLPNGTWAIDSGERCGH